MLLQIERERADLSVQVIQLSERLEEAEGGAESQVSFTIPQSLSTCGYLIVHVRSNNVKAK